PGVRAICVPGSMSVKRAAEAEGLDEIFRQAGFGDEGFAARHTRLVAPAGEGVDDVIHGAEHPRGIGECSARLGKALQRDRPRPLVQENTVDRDQPHPVAQVADEVRGPEFFE
ncbi:MAG: hypothetical protein EB021_10820, partial [Gammaproteobacteria bacterium]|nr:hypothetical protein [Gammaproteobacteria bacterium]